MLSTAIHLPLPPRVALAGDPHGNLVSVEHAITAARRAGLTDVIFLGDCWFYTTDRELVKIDRIAARHDKPVRVWFYRGNHDDTDFLGDRLDTPGVYPLSKSVTFLSDGTRLGIGKSVAVILGGAASTDRFGGWDALRGRNITPRVEGEDWWPREVVTDADADAVVRGGPADIMLSHDVPWAGLSAYGMDVRTTHVLAAAEEAASRDKLSAAAAAVGAELVVHGHLHARVSARGRDGVRYEALNRDRLPGSVVLLDGDTRKIEELV